MKKETKKIKKLFQEIYKKINKVYPHKIPNFKVVHYESGTAGFYNIPKNLIVINSNYMKSVEDTIIHEFCHLINEKFFNPKSRRKLGHNVKFWLLCLEFGLNPKKSYGYGLTKNMDIAYKKMEVIKMQDKTLNELTKQRQDLIREIDSKKEGTDVTELNSQLELVNSKITKRQKELQFETGGIKMAEEPKKEEKIIIAFPKEAIENEAEKVMEEIKARNPTLGDDFTYKVALKIYSTLRRKKAEA